MIHAAIPVEALGAVLIGAALHAAWNVGIRGGADRRAATVAVLLGAALCGAIFLPFLAVPARASWSHLAVSAAFHLLYYYLIAEAYTAGAVSLAYPIMRGTAPALTAAVAALAFGERLGWHGWIGLLAISAGVILLAQPRGEPGERRAVLFALANAAIIAGYTLNDGYGARLSHAPISYALWTFVLPAIPSALILLKFRLGRLFRLGPKALILRGLGGGACSVTSYALALWAMTQTTIGSIAALRETALLFGVLFAWWFLGENPGRRGLLAIGIVACGAAVIQLG
ncbi:MAG: DMT family transporter [Acidiphilium sp.]|jgi:drug/metabolite transporter (DMT)-like permease|uniref:DMT family transporter n=1 Tax=Acidiphilium acidophilum TaxID=76588 RepID=A0AAW9DNU9_ACIAO|nr:DMT family transporter [Acidiphilium acidophilum]MDD2859620.1 DMT family transporter [Acidiphilium sp.]MDX5930244.1 DMT family transporter [Acidiphilium acidophilum]